MGLNLLFAVFSQRGRKIQFRFSWSTMTSHMYVHIYVYKPLHFTPWPMEQPLLPLCVRGPFAVSHKKCFVWKPN